MATISDVAELAGVSVSTAARVLSGRGYAGDNARKQVQAAAEELAYVPNHIARSLRLRSTKMVGLLIADVENSFYSVIAKNVESVMREAGYRVVLCNDNDDPEEEAAYLTLLQGMDVDGLIVTPTPGSRVVLQRLQDRGMSIVQIDRRVPGLKSDAVVGDNEDVTAEAVARLVECGHRDIGMLAGPSKVSTASERVRGYKRALADHGIPWRPELVRVGSFRRDDAVQHALELIDAEPRPTALFASNNILTEACVIALAERGLRVPQQMSLLGFDDMPWMSLVSPRITTVRQPIAEMAVAAAESLLMRLESEQKRSPKTTVFTGEVVWRSSVSRLD